jgi:hypothetical protein
VSIDTLVVVYPSCARIAIRDDRALKADLEMLDDDKEARFRAAGYIRLSAVESAHNRAKK